MQVLPMKRVQGFTTGAGGTTGGKGTLTVGGMTAGLGVATDGGVEEDPAPLGVVPWFAAVGGVTRPVANRFGEAVARLTGAVLGAPTKLTCPALSAVAVFALLTLPEPTTRRW